MPDLYILDDHVPWWATIVVVLVVILSGSWLLWRALTVGPQGQ